jgi:hypothetical protein
LLSCIPEKNKLTQIKREEDNKQVITSAVSRQLSNSSYVAAPFPWHSLYAPWIKDIIIPNNPIIPVNEENLLGYTHEIN